MDRYQDPGKRALAAYFRKVGPVGDIPSQPDEIVVKGKSYVVLSNINGILAVYRILNNGLLKGLRRWPSEIDKHFA
jgi:hypothetical protein